MEENRRKRLIEVAFPLKEVSAHSRREKNIRHGHISALHQWWARRPMAACRAFLYASLVDDPDTEQEREELLKEIADLASWDAVHHPSLVVRTKEQGGSGLTGAQLLKRARQRILDRNGGKAPRLIDPFAGGGAIPLEALRLGCEVTASDLNPVAALILRCTVEYPQQYGKANGRAVPSYIRKLAKEKSQPSFFDGDFEAAYLHNPLAADVWYWGTRMLEEARKELASYYPTEPNGVVPVAYLWSRTIPCQSCGAEMPLIRQLWLARKEKKVVALKPMIDVKAKKVDFSVVEDGDVHGNPDDATAVGGDIKCLVCGQVIKSDAVRRLSREGKMGATMTAVVLQAEDRTGKGYRPDTPDDIIAFKRASKRLEELETKHTGEISLIPDEPIDPATLGLRVDGYGIDEWGKLFNRRQLLTLTTFARLVGEAYTEMIKTGLNPDYARAVTAYLALITDKAADFGSTLCLLNNVGGRGVVHTFGRQILSMAWDYAESNPFCTEGAGWKSYLDRTCETIQEISFQNYGTVRRMNASNLPTNSYDICVTDPPYYNAIDYAGLSDFFYVWLKRSLPRDWYSGDLNLPLTPKKEQAIMASEGNDSVARQRYVEIMADAFGSIRGSLKPGGFFGVVFAHTDPDAWATLIESLLKADLVPDASWPIDTEREGKISAATRANLQTSVWMGSQTRGDRTSDAFVGDVMGEMRPIIRERLLYFWAKGIRGPDFFISAIGPALSVFGRHSRVLRPDGSKMGVGEFLDFVRRESTTVALEQVLRGADLGQIDAITRQYVTWVWSASKAPLDAGEAIALCLATGADYHEVVREGSVAKEAKEKTKKVVRLRTIKERGAEDENLGEDSGARPPSVVDQMQKAAYYWGLNKTSELGSYRGNLGEIRWAVIRLLAQAVAESLPEADEDRRLLLGLLGSNVMASTTPRVEPVLKRRSSPPAGARLPGFANEEEGRE